MLTWATFNVTRIESAILPHHLLGDSSYVDQSSETWNAAKYLTNGNEEEFMNETHVCSVRSTI